MTAADKIIIIRPLDAGLWTERQREIIHRAIDEFRHD